MQTTEFISLVIFLKDKTYFKSMLLGCFFCVLCLFIGSMSYAEQAFRYDSKGKRDPFIPLVTADGRLLQLDQDEAKKDLFLEGIIFDDNGLSYAIVNSEVVRVGDAILSYQVLRIERNRVVFIRDGEPMELELKKEEP